MDQLPQSSDPVLKSAMEEIRTILKDYDVGGTVVLNSRTHGEFLLHDPEWCTVRPEPRGLRIKISAKTDKKGADDTMGFVLGQVEALRLVLGLRSEVALAAVDAIRKGGGEVDHTPLTTGDIVWHRPS
jgi:hypothetical protein